MKRQKNYFIMFFLLACAAITHAQIVQLRSVDIGALLKAGKAHINFVPSYAGDTLKPFDGNQFNALEMVKTDSLTLTIQFDSSLVVEKAKTYFWHNAVWSLESADFLTDLSSKSGTYSLLVTARQANGFQWDSSAFTMKQVKFIRMSIKNPSDSTIRLGEFTLEGSTTFTKFVILPQPIKMVPNTSLQLQLKIQDAQGNLYSNFISSPILWKSSNSTIATVDEFGKVTAIATGNSEISAQTLDQKLKGAATLSVVNDFRSRNVKPMYPKVVLVVQNPAMPGGKKINQMFGWRDPVLLANSLVKHFKEASDSVVNYQIVETINASILFTKYYGSYLSATKYVQLLQEPGWKSLKAASDSGKIYFDYREFVKYYKFDERRNKGEIDEVWVYTGPYLGMYESQLLGPKAFWWNSPPIKDGTALTKLLSVMGLNYERGVDLAFHSFGHRMESAMTQAYYETTGLNWNPKRVNPTPWDLFTRIEKDVPGGAHVGNIHFPPNGTSHYDYGNIMLVTSYAENWFRYPFLLSQTSLVNVQTWIYKPGEPLAETNEQLGYLRWWYGHLPRYEGVTDGVLNNWWHYTLDYEAAVALAKIPIVGIFDQQINFPQEFNLEQNYPNPFNPETVISWQLAVSSFVTLKVYDILGREVATLVNEYQQPGKHNSQFAIRNFQLPSGVYFYTLRAGDYFQTKKMILLK
ncbi:MAG: T9SS type A sorting domain-containing protein [Bacteroidota bacterium]